MNCKTLQDNLCEYLDGALSSSQNTAARRHLEECANCRQMVQNEADFGRLISSRLERAIEPIRLEPYLQRQIAAAAKPNLMRTQRAPILSSWMQPALPLALAAVVLIAIICSKYAVGHRNSAMSNRTETVPHLAKAETVVDVDFCVPTYTFRLDHNTVVDSLNCETRVTEGVLISKN